MEVTVSDGPGLTQEPEDRFLCFSQHGRRVQPALSGREVQDELQSGRRRLPRRRRHAGQLQTARRRTAGKPTCVSIETPDRINPAHSWKRIRHIYEKKTNVCLGEKEKKRESGRERGRERERSRLRYM